MMLTSIRRVIKSAFINFWRNAWVSVATILVMVLAIFMVGGLILFQALLDATLAEVQKKVDVSVYFKTDAEEQDIMKVRDAAQGLPEVASVDYVSRDQALQNFKERHQDNALIGSALDELGGNPLSATLKIRAKNAGDYEAISRFLEDGGFASIDKINYRQNKIIFDRLGRILSVTERVGFGVSLMLGIIAFLVAFNTIRLAIFTARDEIGIMRLVGASNWFVRGPFVVEGAIHGFFATIIAMFIFWPLTLWIGPKAQDFTNSINIFDYFVSNFFQFFLILLVFGVVLGVLSSFVATRRYLKI